MYLISTQWYTNANVHHLKIRKTDEIWVSMKDIGDGLGVTNTSDLVLKEIYVIYEKRKLTKEEIKNYKMTEREIFEEFDNLSMQRVANLFMLKIISWQILLSIVEVKKKED